MKPISDKRLETLIRYAEQTTKPWLCAEVVAALRELQERRKNSPGTSTSNVTISNGENDNG